MKLSVALPDQLFQEGGPLATRKWKGGGLQIEVKVQAFGCSKDERLVISDPAISIGRHYWSAPEIDGEAFKADYEEAKSHMAFMKSFIERRIDQAIAIWTEQRR